MAELKFKRSDLMPGELWAHSRYPYGNVWMAIDEEKSPSIRNCFKDMLLSVDANGCVAGIRPDTVVYKVQRRHFKPGRL